MVIDDAQLQSFLLESGMLSRRDLADIQQQAIEKDQSLEQLLLAHSVLSQDQLRKAASTITGIPFVALSSQDLSYEVLSIIPEPFSRAHQIVAYKKEKNTIELAVLDLPVPNLSFLEPDLRVRIRLTDSESMRTALMRYQKYLKQDVGDRIAQESQDISAKSFTKDLSSDADRPQTKRLLDLLMTHALTSHASDIHFDPLGNSMLVRYRIGEHLYEAMRLPSEAGTHMLARLKNLAQMSPNSSSPQKGRFRLEKDAASSALITLGSMPTLRGERVVLHITPDHTGRNGFTLETLGFRGQSLERMHRALAYPSGLILISSSEGQGKTTTLHTLLDLISDVHTNVMHIGADAPPRLGYIQHIAPRQDIGLSVAAALRAALRQDPDVLGIDHLDSADTATIALEAANQGILVIAGIEAPTAVHGLEWLYTSVRPQLVSATLRASVGVSHVRSLCDEKDTYQPTAADLRELEEIVDPVRIMTTLKEHGATESQTLWKNLSLSRPRACQKCDAGYLGRIGLQEVFPVTNTVRSAILGQADPEELMALARDEGMLMQPEDGVYKALQGYTTLDEVYRMAQGQ